LHEHDEEAAYQCPCEIDGDSILPDLIHVSASVKPLLGSETTMSLTVPVLVHPGRLFATHPLLGAAPPSHPEEQVMAGAGPARPVARCFAALPLCAHAETALKSSASTSAHEHRFMPLPILIILIS